MMDRRPDESLILLASLRDCRGSRERMLRRFLEEIVREGSVTDATVLLRGPRGKMTLCRRRGASLRCDEIPAPKNRPFGAGGKVTARVPDEALPAGREVRVLPVGGGRAPYGALVVGLRRTGPAVDERLDTLARMLAVALDNVRILDDARHESRRDPLTGLANFRALDERLHLEVDRCRRFRSVFAVLMLDLDHFKEFNDRFGHLHGNDVLRKAAAMLRRAVRSIDTAGRWGGDEFLLILPGTDRPGALEAGRRLVDHLTGIRFARARGWTLTASVGAAAFPADGDDVETLVRAADEALYRAKGKGGGVVAA